MGPRNERYEMTDEEKLKFYETLVRRIVVHAGSFGDVHYYISKHVEENPGIKQDAPWFN